MTTKPSSFLLDIDHVHLRRDNKPIIEDLSITLKEGELVALVGPNGSGKSTLLEAIMNTHPLSSGTLRICAGKHCAYLPQLCGMRRDFPLTVKDVVGSGLWGKLSMGSSLSAHHKEIISNALHLVELENYAQTPIQALSGGQFQRVLFARLMVQQGDLLLLDEPFTGIDMPTTLKLLELIQKWHQDGRTLVVVMHNLSLVQDFFPKTLLLARSFSIWGETSKVLTPENLSKAYTKAHEWSVCPC